MDGNSPVTLTCDLRPLGDRAILIRLFLPGLADHTKLSQEQRYNLMLAARLLAAHLGDSVPGAAGWPVEFVPGYDTVLAPYDPDRLSFRELKIWLVAQIGPALDRWREKGFNENGLNTRLHHIPVIYGGQYGPDLEAVASKNGLSPEELVELHSQAEYSVYLIGFAPGFAYMGALPEGLEAPRLPRPRPKVPAGSVAIAAGLTGVYPFSMPGGWNLLGYTPFAIFDPAQEPPVRFLPGDRVKFYPVEAARLPELQAAGLSFAAGEDRP